jgi:hypothetical protein
MFHKHPVMDSLEGMAVMYWPTLAVVPQSALQVMGVGVLEAKEALLEIILA